MTKSEAIKGFTETYKKIIAPKYETTHPDIPMRVQEWSYFIDDLCKEGIITEKQYNDWSLPAFCTKD